MNIERLKYLLDKGVFNEEEQIHVKRIINELPLGEKNIGVPDVIRFKYYLGFNVEYAPKEELLKELIERCKPPEGIENYNVLFHKYGHTVYGFTTKWEWYREENLTLALSKKGYAPIENATEEECWKMLAISAFYWQRFYEEKYGKGE